MSFDYAGIEKNAEKRRACLRDLEEALFAQPEMLAKLNEVFQWAGLVYRTYSAIDAEGRTLIPNPARSALLNANTTLARISSAIEQDGSGIRKWVA